MLTIETKLNRLKNWQVGLIMAAIGCLVFCTGLTNPLQGDDLPQIVNNVPVHSITHIKLFFEGGTFYNGHGLTRLDGVYYRPLMTTIFSIIYTLFGAQSIYYHLIQLALCISSVFILYLFFTYSFKPLLAFVLAVLFLVHPLRAITVFAVPDMQDALYFFFGILALLFIVRSQSAKSLGLAAICLLLSLLSKETGLLFVILGMAYLFWWNRSKFVPFFGMICIPVGLWLGLRIHAIGLVGLNPHNAPIDSLNLAGRLLTAPSIAQFYITRLIFPWHLASAYYWVHPSPSFKYTIIPSLIVLATIGFSIWVGYRILRKATKAQFYTYIFFGFWVMTGMVLILQIVPLDFTANNAWFYFPMVGVLGMLGSALSVLKVPKLLGYRLAGALLLVLLVSASIETAQQGRNWRSPEALAVSDIALSPDDYTAYNGLSLYDLQRGEYSQAETYARRSIAIYPTYTNYLNLGDALLYKGDYAGAEAAYRNSLNYANYSSVYENLSALSFLNDSPAVARQTITTSLNKFPQDTTLWMYLAILDDKQGDNVIAQTEIRRAALYGNVPQNIYDSIINNQPFGINLIQHPVDIP